jgi:hypothetical protein
VIALRRAALLLAVPTLCLAQVRGSVRDEAGQPVAEAFVELLGAGARLAVTATAPDGSFSFLAAPSAVAVVVRKIGHVPARIQLAHAPQPLVIVLRRRAVAVQGISVAAPGGRCVERDRAEARQVWERASQRYASGVLIAALWADVLRGAADVPPDSFGVMDSSRATRGVVAGSGRRPRPDERERFYAQPPLLGVGRSFQWEYPWLESIQAWHFADRLFGELNWLSLAPPELGDLVIEFCSRRGDRPYIVGRLYLGADTTFLKAEWRFVTTRPAEVAGGEVVFMPPAPGAPLLAASGHFWRAKTFGYYQEWSSYLQWYACDNITASCRAGERRPLGR